MRASFLLLLSALSFAACNQEKKETTETVTSETTTAKAGLHQLHWFAGSWQLSHHDTITRETWQALPDGSLSGTGITYTPKDTLFREKMQLLLLNDTLVYRAFPGGATKGTDFRLVRHSEKEAIFENLVNDFPKRIRYHQPTPDSMHARISGPMEGKEVSEDFRMVKVK
jgi:hypothetical protein